MAYQVDKFNGTFLVSVADGTVDTTTDLRLLGKNYAGYGEVQNENFLHLLENFANTSAPPKAINGQVWFDSSAKKLKYYDADNNKWRTTGSLEVSATAPLKLNVGDFWYDTSADQLYSWNGTTYVLIGPQASVGAGTTATLIAVVKGTDAINHNIVKILAGAGDTIAVVSSDEFTLDSVLNPIPGFSLIKKGFTLVNTSASTGVTTTDHVYWGTASNAAKLGGVAAVEFVQRTSPAFISQVSFTNSGYTVGSPGNNLAVFIELGDQPVIESRNSARITMRIREDVNTTYDLMEFVAPSANPGAAIPGVTGAFDLGSPLYKWLNLYANTVNGNLIGNVTGNVTGVHKGNLTALDDSVAYNATTKSFNGAFAGILTGNVIGDVTGTSSNAFTLNGQTGSTAATGSTVTLRDSSGNITANSFLGTATQANVLRVDGGLYQSATTSPAANSIVSRDASGNISANFVNATSTASNSLQADAGPYRTASVNPIGNTIVVRDASGNIQVNGIVGAATNAIQLQVDGTSYRTASTSGIANTIAVRDASNILRSGSIQTTPIGSIEPSTGGFTTLGANGLVRFTNTTASTSKTTGSVVLNGGLGVAGDVYATSFNGVFNGTLTGNITGNASFASSSAAATIATKVENAVSGTGEVDLVYASMAGSDQFRIRVGGTASNAGWAEIATADDGTEPIYVRQYNGVFLSAARTATLLDELGNTQFPGTMTVTRLVESSSIAYKENVSPIEGALGLVNQLSGVIYDRKDGSSKNEAGLIAEDVAKILPNIVQLNNSGSADGVQYTKLTAYLIEAVKTLTSEIEELKRKLK